MGQFKPAFTIIDQADDAGTSYPGEQEDVTLATMNASMVTMWLDQCEYRAEDGRNRCVYPDRTPSPAGILRSCIGKRCPRIIHGLKQEL